MSYATDLADGVALAKDLLVEGELLVDVVHHVAGAHTGFSTAAPTDVTRQGTVSDRLEMVKMADGKEVQSRHRVTFFEHVAVDADRDRFTVPGGTAKAPVLDVRGFRNAEAGGRFVTVVMLG